MMKIFLVRHAETTANVKRIIQGQADYDLTDKGAALTIKTAEYLKNCSIEKIFTSSSLRTIKTADIISKITGITDIVKSDNLKEINLRPWEGRKMDELMEDKSLSGYYTYINYPDKFIPVDGEGIKDMQERVYNAIIGIVDSVNFTGNIGIVSHSVAIRAFLLAIEGKGHKDIWKYDIKPSSITTISYIDNKFTIDEVGYAPYLENG